MRKCIYTLLLISILVIFNPICVKAQEKSQNTYLSEYQQYLCEYYGEMFYISPQLLMAIIETESSGNMNATNGSCYGICQISSVHGTHLDNEAKQIAKCCVLLESFLEEEPDIAFALDRYNGNSNAWKNFNNGYVSKYSQKVLNRAYEIEDAQGLHDY